MIGIANQFLGIINKAFSQGKMNRTKLYTGIQILKNAVQTLNLFSRVGEYEIFETRFFVFFKIMDQQAEILVKRWLGFDIKIYSLISLITEESAFQYSTAFL